MLSGLHKKPRYIPSFTKIKCRFWITFSAVYIYKSSIVQMGKSRVPVQLTCLSYKCLLKYKIAVFTQPIFSSEKNTPWTKVPNPKCYNSSPDETRVWTLTRYVRTCWCITIMPHGNTNVASPIAHWIPSALFIKFWQNTRLAVRQSRLTIIHRVFRESYNSHGT